MARARVLKAERNFFSLGKNERPREKQVKAPRRIGSAGTPPTAGTGPAKIVRLMKGKFITFEGSEGCGKSTQSKLLYNYLKRKGLPVIYLREPGATRISEKLRNILLDPKNIKISPECEMLLYMAARSQIVDEIIQPALKKGYMVISDRYLDSTVVYQGYGLGLDISLINLIGKFVTHSMNPDLTILLDLPVEKGLRHRRNVEDRIEQRGIAYHTRVRDGYLKLAAQDPKRIKIVKVSKDKNKTQKKIREALMLETVSIPKRKLFLF